MKDDTKVTMKKIHNPDAYVRWLINDDSNNRTLAVVHTDHFVNERKRRGYIATFIVKEHPECIERMLDVCENPNGFDDIMMLFDELDCDSLICSHLKVIPRPTLWHEVGHFRRREDVDMVKAEVKAHCWALFESMHRGFNVVTKELMDKLNSWTKEGTPPIYKEARDIILKEFRKGLPNERNYR